MSGLVYREWLAEMADVDPTMVEDITEGLVRLIHYLITHLLICADRRLHVFKGVVGCLKFLRRLRHTHPRRLQAP